MKTYFNNHHVVGENVSIQFSSKILSKAKFLFRRRIPLPSHHYHQKSPLLLSFFSWIANCLVIIEIYAWNLELYDIQRRRASPGQAFPDKKAKFHCKRHTCNPSDWMSAIHQSNASRNVPHCQSPANTKSPAL